MNFESQKNSINFLNVKSFVGSRLGLLIKASWSLEKAPIWK